MATLESLADELIARASRGEPGGAAAVAVLVEHASDEAYGQVIDELAGLGLWTLANQRRAFLDRAKQAH